MTQLPASGGATPVWFGPTDRPLFGWVTTPRTKTAIGGLLVAPTLGREARAGSQALRFLAEVAARQGFVVLRFDFDGTGDSSGSLDDPDRDRVWKENVAHGTALLASLGVTEVSAIGLRLGATIVGASASDTDLGLRSLVLWDPCESGRTFLRELGALEALRLERSPVSADGSIVTAEFVFSKHTAEELRRLDLTSGADHPLASRVLVVTRGDRTVSAKLTGRLEREQTTWRTTDEQGRLFDVDPLFAVVPERTVNQIVGWLAAGATDTWAFNGPEQSTSAAVVATTEHTPIVERCVRLGRKQLFGIVCDGAEVQSDAPLVVFLNVSNEDHTGPSRLWVELSRRWAARGLRSVRFDLSGLGDSPSTSAHLVASIYDHDWLEETVGVATELAADPTNVVLIGLCSGAFWAVEAGIALRARGVCAINPPVGIDFLHGVTRLGASKSALLRGLAERLKDLAIRLRWVAVVLWKLVRVVIPSVFSVNVMRTLVDGGTDLLVLSSAEGLAPRQGHPSLDRFFSRRLVVPANYEVTFVPGLDHSMHDAEGRLKAVELLEHHVLSAFTSTDDGVDNAATTDHS